MIDCCGEFRKTKNPGLPQLASPNRVGTTNPAAGEVGEETSADSDELRGFLGGNEWFGRPWVPRNSTYFRKEIFIVLALNTHRAWICR